jgi:murein DD-endopeptidase MepM/ murein hydrolase activator NlpD
MKATDGRKETRVPWGWAALVVVSAAMAYLGGAVLAQRWTPPLARPDSMATPHAESAPWITSGESAEGTLGAEAVDEWRFQAQAGEATTVEMWFHPGLGSSLEGRLAVQLVAPSGAVLAETQGSIFLPPYLLEPSLPETGIYRIKVLAASGAPGRYSLGLTLSQVPAQTEPGETPVYPAAAALDSPSAAAAASFQWPTTRRAISGWTFHDPGNPGHIGLDIAAKMWDPIVAVDDGEVVFASWGGGYGNLVIVDHGNGWRSYYAHFTEIAVDLGQDVRQGETLGGAGTTGYSTGPHLHFELRYQGRPVDPHIYLP